MFNRSALALIIMLFCSHALSATGFLKGDSASGMTKICYYNGPSGDFTKTVSSVVRCPQSAYDYDGGKPNTISNTNGLASTESISGLNELSREITSGLNKICYYKSIRGTFTKIVGSHNTCPLSAER